MKKYSLLMASLILSAVLAQSQTQTQPSPGARPVPGQPAPGQITPQPGPGVNLPTDPNAGRTIPAPPNPVPFGGTNQVRFGTNNVPFATNNQGFAATNTVGTNINEAAGAANPSATNSATLADQAFTQQLRAALARPGATQIFFPQTRSTITVMNQNGAVTLQGFVANEGERRSLEERIKNAAGVTSVNNQLQINTGQNRGINPVNPVPGTAAPGNETNRQLFNP